MKFFLIGLISITATSNALAIACISQYGVNSGGGCVEFTSAYYTDYRGISAMYKCRDTVRVDVIGMCGNEISDQQIVHNYDSPEANTSCFCRITYPFLSKWEYVSSDACGNGQIGCVGACAQLVEAGNWTPYN